MQQDITPGERVKVLKDSIAEQRRVYDEISTSYDQLRVKALALIAGEVALGVRTDFLLRRRFVFHFQSGDLTNDDIDPGMENTFRRFDIQRAH